MSPEQNKVYNFLEKLIFEGKTYYESIDILIDVHNADQYDKKTIEVYNAFCYMSDRRWDQVKNKMKENYEYAFDHK